MAKNKKVTDCDVLGRFICPLCESDKTDNVGLRKRPSKAPGRSFRYRYNPYCRDCQNALQREHYLRNKGKRRDWNRKARIHIKNLVFSIKKERGCEVRHPRGCAAIAVDPAALDFHHINPDEKSFLISEQVARMGGKDRILREVMKCVVVCANCHRIIHSGVKAEREQTKNFIREIEKLGFSKEQEISKK